MSPGVHDPRMSPLTEALLAGALVLALMTVATWLQYVEGHRILIGEFRMGMQATANALASLIDGEAHATLHEAGQEAMSTEPYLSMHKTLRAALSATPEYSYIYTAIRKDAGFVFVVDGGEPGSDIFSPLHDPYINWIANPALQRAWRDQEPVASEQPYTDEWGTFMSAYAPVRDKQGRFVALLGVDVNLRDFFLRVSPLKIVALRSFVGSVLISLVIGVLIYMARMPRGGRTTER